MGPNSKQRINRVQFSGPICRKLLSTFLINLLNHNFIPCRMLKGEIRPIIKNNSSSKISSSNNTYAKLIKFVQILEYCLLPILSEFLPLNSRQFGYGRNTG